MLEKAATILHELTSINRAPLKDVHRVAKLASDNIVSIGSSLSHVHVPGRKVTEAGEDELTFEEVEIGMGKQHRNATRTSEAIVFYRYPQRSRIRANESRLTRFGRTNASTHA